MMEMLGFVPHPNLLISSEKFQRLAWIVENQVFEVVIVHEVGAGSTTAFDQAKISSSE